MRFQEIRFRLSPRSAFVFKIKTGRSTAAARVPLTPRVIWMCQIFRSRVDGGRGALSSNRSICRKKETGLLPGSCRLDNYHRRARPTSRNVYYLSASRCTASASRTTICARFRMPSKVSDKGGTAIYIICIASSAECQSTFSPHTSR